MRVGVARFTARFIAAFTTIALLVELAAPSFSVAENPPAVSLFKQRLDVYQQQLSFFQQTCMKNNQVSVITIVDPVDQNSINCPAEAAMLDKERAELAKELPAIEQEIQDQCGSQQASAQSAIAALKAQVEEAQPACTAQEKLELSRGCAKSLECDALRGIIYDPLTSIGPFLRTTVQVAHLNVGSCLDAGKSDCTTTFIAGAIKDLLANVTMAWDLLKGVSSFAWSLANPAQSHLSDKMHAASQMSSQEVQKFLSDPIGTVKGWIGKLHKMISDAIRESFTCAKWSGPPFLSQCAVPAPESWDCATCGQRLEATCGVVGVLGGEILAAFLTGGALSVGKAAAKVGVAAMERVSAEVVARIPQLSHVLEVAAKAGAITGKAIAVTVKIGGVPAEYVQRLLSSPVVRAISDFSSQGAKRIAELAKAASLNPAVKTGLIPVRVGSLVVKMTIGQYFTLMERAFKLGLRTGDQLTARLLQAVKAKQIASRAGVAATAGLQIDHSSAVSQLAQSFPEVRIYPKPSFANQAVEKHFEDVAALVGKSGNLLRAPVTSEEAAQINPILDALKRDPIQSTNFDDVWKKRLEIANQNPATSASLAKADQDLFPVIDKLYTLYGNASFRAEFTEDIIRDALLLAMRDGKKLNFAELAKLAEGTSGDVAYSLESEYFEAALLHDLKSTGRPLSVTTASADGAQFASSVTNVIWDLGESDTHGPIAHLMQRAFAEKALGHDGAAQLYDALAKPNNRVLFGAAFERPYDIAGEMTPPELNGLFNEARNRKIGLPLSTGKSAPPAPVRVYSANAPGARLDLTTILSKVSSDTERARIQQVVDSQSSSDMPIYDYLDQQAKNGNFTTEGQAALKTLSNAERRNAAIEILKKYYSQAQIDGTNMIDGVMSAHYSYDKPIGSLDRSDLRKIAVELDSFGIKNPNARRELIETGICGSSAEISGFRTTQVNMLFHRGPHWDQFSAVKNLTDKAPELLATPLTSAQQAVVARDLEAAIEHSNSLGTMDRDYSVARQAPKADPFVANATERIMGAWADPVERLKITAPFMKRFEQISVLAGGASKEELLEATLLNELKGKDIDVYVGTKNISVFDFNQKVLGKAFLDLGAPAGHGPVAHLFQRWFIEQVLGQEDAKTYFNLLKKNDNIPLYDPFFEGDEKSSTGFVVGGINAFLRGLGYTP